MNISLDTQFTQLMEINQTCLFFLLLARGIQVVEGKHSVYRMSAATEEDKQEWIKCLTQSISHNPFYDILIQRKKKALTVS